jgi:diguanylate cyclase (GGDEF)-like protein
MELWNKRVLTSVFLPGGAILLGSILLLNSGWINPSISGVNFFYYAVFIAAVPLAWRFHSTRILFSAIVLLLGHRAIEFFAQGRIVSAGPGRIAFESVALLIPLNFILLTFFLERGSEGRSLFWFLGLLFFESVFVAVIARPDQPMPGFLHFSLIPSFHSRVPQPALLLFIAALCLLLVRLLQFQKPTISGMFWSLIATGMGLNAGGVGKTSTVYFGTAALILASSIIENSYSLAYQDELTGLNSRRSFNDALLRLKTPYVIAAVDIDHFKSVNDTYGHDTGDEVLRLVASRLARVGGGGEPYRVGGEEFTVLFPGKTAKEIIDYLELLRLNIESSNFRIRSGEERRKITRSPDRRSAAQKRSTPREPRASTLSVTVSIGLAESQPKLSVEEVIQQADKALYRAKQGGRNRIETAGTQRKVVGFRPKKSAQP